MTFQAIAPSSPPRTTSELTMETSMSPFPIVFATAVPNEKAATKLKKAAQKTAWNGERTRVDTTVAIEFAESCIPLMKSKTRATRMIARMNVMRVASRVLEYDAFENVRDRLAVVDAALHVLVDV